MKKLLFVAAALLLAAACLRLDPIDPSLEFGDCSKLKNIRAEGDTLIVAVSWTGEVWSISEDPGPDKDTMIVDIYPYSYGGDYNATGSTAMMLYISENRSSSPRESTLVLQGYTLGEDKKPLIVKTVPMVQKGR